MSKPETFAECLRRLREQAGLTKYEVAKRTGLSKQTLSKLEQGDREPAWGTVRLLAHVLGVSVTAFEVGPLPLPDLTTPAHRGRPRKAAEGPASGPAPDEGAKPRKAARRPAKGPKEGAGKGKGKKGSK